MARPPNPRRPEDIHLVMPDQSHRPAPNTPRTETGMPAAPAHLGAVAKGEFRRVVKELRQWPGLSGKVDRAAIAIYSECWARWRKAIEEVHENGMIVYQEKVRTTAKGDETRTVTPIPNPWLRVAQATERELRQQVMVLGFCPAARARIHMPKKGGSIAEELAKMRKDRQAG